MAEENNVKISRRIEITAFRRRVNIVSGAPLADIQEYEDVCINNAHSHEGIDIESDEGQRILAESVRLIEGRLTGKPGDQSG